MPLRLSRESNKLVLRGLFSAPSAMRLSANHNLHTVTDARFPILISSQRMLLLGRDWGGDGAAHPRRRSGRRVQDQPAPLCEAPDGLNDEEAVVVNDTDHIV